MENNMKYILKNKKCISNKKQVNGITLIALMITIIVLLILAGVTLSLTLGERGIFNLAKKSQENYANAQDREIADLEKLYSEVKIATGDNSQITISMEELNKFIENKINEKTNIGNNYAVFSFDSNDSYIGTNKTELTLKELSENEACEKSNNCIKIKKSGYYIITGSWVTALTNGTNYQKIELNSNDEIIAMDQANAQSGISNGQGNLSVCRFFNAEDVINVKAFCWNSGNTKFKYEGTITLISQ